ncbi:MAG: hypothetical protein WD043_10550 [Gemmatimonadales bacterium]
MSSSGASSCFAVDRPVPRADRLQDRADVASIARRRGQALDWDAVLERLTPLAEAKGQADTLEAIRALQVEFGA